LHNEILEARNKDQRERQKVVEALKGSLHTKVPEEIENAVIEIDRSNNSLIKEVICRYGWPSFSLVGEDGSDAFWLLVQHQDRDV